MTVLKEVNSLIDGHGEFVKSLSRCECIEAEGV
jgi:hypothetical protein